jgi:2-C-methyl-D-erythritol 2,4-cyclodiphosphate synthase
VIGGVEIAHSMGLLGHSDADVLLHAITDACWARLRWATSVAHFPDTDVAVSRRRTRVPCCWQEAARRVRAAGYDIGNIDSTVVAQAPRLAAHIPAMRVCIAAAGPGPEQVNVKAKTAERLGRWGRAWPWRRAPWCCSRPDPVGMGSCGPRQCAPLHCPGPCNHGLSAQAP